MDGIIVSGLTHRATGRGYLSADHISTATGLDPAFTISKNGGNFANPAAGASVMTEIEVTDEKTGKTYKFLESTKIKVIRNGEKKSIFAINLLETDELLSV